MTPSRTGRQDRPRVSFRKNRPARRPWLEDLEGRQLLAVSQLAGLPGLTGVEATSFSGEVGTFKDTDPHATPANFSVTINWGDGVTSAGTVTEDNAGTFSISGSHTYAQYGSYPVGLSVTDANQQTTTIGLFTQTDLVSDLPGHAQNTDPNFVGPVSLTSTGIGTWWVTDAGKGIAIAYNGATGTPSPTTITIPPAAGSANGALGSPTAVVSDRANVFLDPSGVPYTLLFATKDGTISAWNSGPSASVKVDLSSQGASFEGLAIVPTDSYPIFYATTDGFTYPGGPFYYPGSPGSLYATDFHNGKIDVFDSTFKLENLGLTSASIVGTPGITLPGDVINPPPFTDPNLPAGYAPFGIQYLNGNIYVTYAQQDAAKLDPVAGPGKGLIDVFSATGYFLRRFATGGALNAPYSMALAPSSFGPFAGDLLVSNTGDGRISAYDLNTGALKGQVEDNTGQPIDGLRGIAFGTDGQGSPTGPLYFTAAPNGGADGLFGTIAPLANSPVTSIQVNDAPLQAQGTTFSGQEGTPGPVPLVVARFSDANPNASTADFTATVDWGDGTITTGTISTALYPPGTAQPADAAGATFSVIASNHTYMEEGTYHITVTIKDAGGSTIAVKSEADIAGAPINASPVPFTAIVGEQLDSTVATFSEPYSFTNWQTYPGLAGNSGQTGSGTVPTTTGAMLPAILVPLNAADFTATIDWGDGSTSAGQVVSNWNNSFSVEGSHTYASIGTDGTYRVTVTIHDDDGTTTQVVSTAAVFNRPPTVTPVTISAAAGQPFSGTVANAAGPLPGPIGSYSATINWGDGSTSPGTIVPSSSSGFSVQGAHTYAGSGASFRPVTVTINQPGPATWVVSTAVVAGVPIGLTGGLSPTSDTQPTFVGNTGPGAFVALLAVPEKGGQASLVGSGFADASGHWQIATNPLADGQYVITAVAIDGFTSTTALATIMPASHPLVVVKSNPTLGRAITNNPGGSATFNQASHPNTGHHLVAPLHTHKERLTLTGMNTSTISPDATFLSAHRRRG